MPQPRWAIGLLAALLLPAWESAGAQGSWQRVGCPFDSARALLPVTCGRLAVPENPDQPGRSIEIAFMVVRPRHDLDPGRPVLFLSGGPGAPSLVYAEMLVADPQVLDVVVDREWVFYDQRGSGRSTPALRCGRGENYLERVASCRDSLLAVGVDLAQYTSARSAGDIEALRIALGVDQWNLWGISYGSRLAFAVARDYPTAVRSIIHDGPSYPVGREIIDDFRGTEVAIHRLLSKCAADPACRSRYPDLRARFLAALPGLRDHPVVVGEERVDDNRLAHWIRGNLFSGDPSVLEPQLQGVLAYMDAAARGDGTAMASIQAAMPRSGVEDPPIPEEGWFHLGQNLSIECNEERSFESAEQYRQAATESELLRSLFGADGGVGEFEVCARWPSGHADPASKTRVPYDGPHLIFSGELDASLSGLSGYEIAMRYPQARNVVFRNALHGQVHLADVPPRAVDGYRACALALAHRFLADPGVELDTRCAEARRLRLAP